MRRAEACFASSVPFGEARRFVHAGCRQWRKRLLLAAAENRVTAAGRLSAVDFGDDLLVYAIKLLSGDCHLMGTSALW
jgi:hypothetical protein